MYCMEGGRERPDKEKQKKDKEGGREGQQAMTD